MAGRVSLLIALAVCIFTQSVLAETYQGEPSNRVKINLGATAWKLIKSDAIGGQTLAYNDASGVDIETGDDPFGERLRGHRNSPEL